MSFSSFASPGLIRWAHRVAHDLAESLARYRTPETGDPVDPSIPAAIHRYVLTDPAPEHLDRFLRAFAGSSVGALTRSSLPQAQEVARRVDPVVRQLREMAQRGEVPADAFNPALAYVLGWARRSLQVSDRARGQAEGSRRGADRRAGRR